MPDLPPTGLPAFRIPNASLIAVDGGDEFWLFRQRRPAWIWATCDSCYKHTIIHWASYDARDHLRRRRGSNLCGSCAFSLYDQRESTAYIR